MVIAAEYNTWTMSASTFPVVCSTSNHWSFQHLSADKGGRDAKQNNTTTTPQVAISSWCSLPC